MPAPPPTPKDHVNDSCLPRPDGEGATSWRTGKPRNAGITPPRAYRAKSCCQFGCSEISDAGRNGGFGRHADAANEAQTTAAPSSPTMTNAPQTTRRVTLPRLGRSARQLRRNIQLRWLLLRIHPTWRRMTLGIEDVVLRPQPMSPFDVLAVRPARRLHRRVIEIRDCEFKRPAFPLTHYSVALLNHIEDALTRY